MQWIHVKLSGSPSCGPGRSWVPPRASQPSHQLDLNMGCVNAVAPLSISYRGYWKNWKMVLNSYHRYVKVIHEAIGKCFSVADLWKNVNLRSFPMLRQTHIGMGQNWVPQYLDSLFSPKPSIFTHCSHLLAPSHQQRLWKKICIPPLPSPASRSWHRAKLLSIAFRCVWNRGGIPPQNWQG